MSHLNLFCELICHTLASWNKNLIREGFLPMDFDAILSIPLPTWNMEDFWSSDHDSRVLFSARSAYQMLVAMKKWRETWFNTSSSEAGEKSWTAMWRSQAPLKICLFIRRLAQLSLQQLIFCDTEICLLLLVACLRSGRLLVPFIIGLRHGRMCVGLGWWGACWVPNVKQMIDFHW